MRGVEQRSVRTRHDIGYGSRRDIGAPVAILGLCGVLLAAGASPAHAADCVSGSGMVETVRPCDNTGKGDSDQTVPDGPRSVSIIMTRRAPVTTTGPAATAGGDAALVAQVAQRWRIDPHLLGAMVHAESAGNARAISYKGALGLMQVMPATARSMGVADPSSLLADPRLALETGAAYLKTLQARLGNNVPLVVAAYNAGPGAVLKAGMQVPAFRETQAYVGKVMASYVAARGGLPALAR